MAECIRCGKNKSDRTKTQYCKSCGCIVKRNTPRYIQSLRGRKPPMLGKKHSEEAKLKMVKNFHRGEKHYNWRGGVAPCIDCGGKKCRNKKSLRCKPCSLLLQKGVNHPWYGRKHKPESINIIKSKLIGKPTLWNSGKNSHLWKGGISPLAMAIRNSLYSATWRTGVFKRDIYVCQECGVHNNDLRSHHIRPFKDILQEFLQMYSQFSVIDDRDTLIRLAESYEPFWDIDNGKTFCRDCHKKEHSEVNL